MKNIHSVKKIKKLDRGNCRSANIVYKARYKIHGDIYIGNTGEALRERLKNRADAKNRPDNNQLALLAHNYLHNLDKDIEVLILKRNLHQRHKRNYGKTNSSVCWAQKHLRE